MRTNWTSLTASAAGALFAIGLAGSAVAQTATMPATPTVDDTVAAAKNQLGILEYCNSKGFSDAETLALQAKLLSILPPVTDAAKVDAAYKAGQQGVISAMGQQTSLADAAKAQGADEASLCSKMAEVVKQSAAMMPK